MSNEMAHLTSPATDRRGFAAGLSIGIVVASVAVFLFAGRDRSFGPLDRETAQGLALVMWVLAPIAGGLVARQSTTPELIRPAFILGFVVALGVALFPAAGTGLYTCSINLPAGPWAYIAGRFAVGALVGGGMAAGLIGTAVAARSRLTVLPGLALAAAVNYVASAAAYALFYEAVRCL